MEYQLLQNIDFSRFEFELNNNIIKSKTPIQFILKDTCIRKMKRSDSGFNMDLELSFSLIEKLQTLCNELISKFELQQKFTFYTLKKNVYKLQCEMNKNVNSYDNNTRDEIKRKMVYIEL